MDRLIVFTAIFGAFWLLSQWAGEVHHAPGVLVPLDPSQENYPSDSRGFHLDGWNLSPVASYKITARVLKTRDYDSTPIDKLVPLDLLLGWGPMSDTAVIDKLALRISNRYATWRWWGQPPISPEEISLHTSNHHLVPANDLIRQQLQAIRTGDIVTLHGELVNISDTTGRLHYRSSLSRSDTGPGACEVMLVKFVSIR